MDELHFHARRRSVVAEPCVFEKALLAGCAGCDRAVRHALAEREVLACASPVARTNCETLHALLRERSAFALRLPLPGERLPHAVTMQLVCGGLRGVGECMQQAPEDVHDLVATAQARYGSLLDLPWPAIVAAVASWKVRRRHDRGSVR